MGAFVDKFLVVSDSGDGQNLLVQNGPETFTLPMSRVDQIILGGLDIADFIAFNLAARLALSGKTSCQSSPGVADPACLTLLNSASFKAY
jgi:hypothetical protein